MSRVPVIPRGFPHSVRARVIALGVAALALIGPSRRAPAQFFDGTGGQTAPVQNIEGFTVVGRASIPVRPNLLEVDLEVSAAAELTADAIVKYRDAKRRIHDAFTALKLPNVSLEERALLVGQKGAMSNPYYFEYNPNQRSKTEVQLSRKLVVKAAELRKLDEEAVLQLVGRLLDVAQDAGAQVGPNNQNNNYYIYRGIYEQNTGLARFVVEDFEAVQEQVYEKAIADARSRAERLARLSQLELGPVVAVRELSVPAEPPGSQGWNEPPAKKRLESARYQEIPVRVELLVRFEVHRKGGQGGARSSAP